MKKDYRTISIITPNLNGERYLEETILSVIEQGYANLEYIIIDGGSTDGSLEIIQKYRNQIIYFESKKDEGLYDALNKGFQRSTGEIMGWLNSDDILHRKSLFTLAEIFSSYPDIQWLQGYPTVIDETGRIVFHRPPVYEKEFFYKMGYINGSFIQQESTFWRRSLWNKAGSFISTDYKFAGDFELWIRFFHHAPLFISKAMIGAFRMRKEGQISKTNYVNYIRECDEIIEKNRSLLPEDEQYVLKHDSAEKNRSADKQIQIEFNFTTYTFSQSKP